MINAREMKTGEMTKATDDCIALLFRALVATKELCPQIEAVERLGLARESELFGDRTCYVMTPLFAHTYGSDIDLERDLKPMRKKRAYALLKFCLSRPLVGRIPLTGVDFEADFSRFNDRRIRPRDYYWAEPNLGFFLFDSGTEAACDRLCTNCVEALVKKHRDISAFADQIESKQFELGVVTPYESKKERLEAAIRRRRLFDNVPVHILAAPELAEG